MNPIQQLRALGQSVWLDTIRRDLLETGELEALIAAGEVSGITSNPTIFEKAIAETDLYTAALRPLAQMEWAAERSVDALMIDDVRSAADLFLPLYEETNGRDGFVSIEVSPKLAADSGRSLAEARRLWAAVNRPNLMVKIPGTRAGLPAIEQAIAEGININITLIFALDRYAEVMEAYLRGLEARVKQGASLDHLASVASFFVSRVDGKVDAKLEALVRQGGPQGDRAASLKGKIAVANAKLAYAQFKAVFSSERFSELERRGARVQRPLWASTSTKDPAYPDTYYVDNLIGPDTVNTVPALTLQAFRDHGTAQPTLERDLSAARAQLDALRSLGISLPSVTDELEQEGVERFDDSYISLVKTVARRQRSLRKELSALRTSVAQTLEELGRDQVAARLWRLDGSLWTVQPAQAEEARRRMGWLGLPQDMEATVDGLQAFAAEVRRKGFRQAVLLGMGGSSLAPDVFRRTLASPEGLAFTVLDSTDPEAVRRVTRLAPVTETLFVVSSKSGTTTEPNALMEHFWSLAARRLGDGAGEHFVAITDPGTPLEAQARERGFLRIFAGVEAVGGRYSALSPFGLVPAALMGIDLRALLRGGRRMAHACGPSVEPVRNPGLFLGAVLGTAARLGRDKATFVADSGLAPLEDWIEQLIAESSGKSGKGILPIVGEPPGAARVYGADRLLVYLRRDGAHDRRVRGWVRAGLPVAVVEVGEGPAGLGAAFFQWEVAVAVACHVIGVDAFDQPDVQRAKDRTAELLKVYRRQGALPQPEVVWHGPGVALWGKPGAVDLEGEADMAGVARRLLGLVRPGEAWVTLVYQRADAALERRLAGMRRAVRDRRGVATASGIGPRYLHSTGQYHKGGPDRMVFIIVSSEPRRDLTVPDMGCTFGVLERAEAIGDLQALLALKRRAFGLHLDSPRGLPAVLEAFKAAAAQSEPNLAA